MIGIVIIISCLSSIYGPILFDLQLGSSCISARATTTSILYIILNWVDATNSDVDICFGYLLKCSSESSIDSFWNEELYFDIGRNKWNKSTSTSKLNSLSWYLHRFSQQVSSHYNGLLCICISRITANDVKTND